MDFVIATKIIQLTESLRISVSCWWLILLDILVVLLLGGVILVKFFNDAEKRACFMVGFSTFVFYFFAILLVGHDSGTLFNHLRQCSQLFLIFVALIFAVYNMFGDSRKKIRWRVAISDVWGCALGALIGTLSALILIG